MYTEKIAGYIQKKSFTELKSTLRKELTQKNYCRGFGS